MSTPFNKLPTFPFDLLDTQEDVNIVGEGLHEVNEFATLWGGRGILSSATLAYILNDVTYAVNELTKVGTRLSIALPPVDEVRRSHEKVVEGAAENGIELPAFEWHTTATDEEE